MWFWQHKNIVKQYRIAFYTTMASLLVHLIFFICFFFVISDRNAHISFTIAPRNNPILYTVMPMHASSTRMVARSSSSPSVSRLSSGKKAAKAIKPQTVIQQTQKSVVQKNKNKTKKAEPKKKTAVKKNEPKKQETKKKIETHEIKNKEPQKPEPKKELAPEKQVPDPLPVEAVPPLPQSSAASEAIPVSEHDELIAQQTHQLALHDVGLYEEYVQLQETIVGSWAPPPGIQRDVLCQITFCVDWQGVVTSMNIDQSSGVLMYDVSARTALESITMPRWTWGKTLTITFNQ